MSTRRTDSSRILSSTSTLRKVIVIDTEEEDGLLDLKEEDEFLYYSSISRRIVLFDLEDFILLLDAEKFVLLVDAELRGGGRTPQRFLRIKEDHYRRR